MVASVYPVETLQRCPVCNGGAWREILTHPDGFIPLLRLQRCAACGTVFLNPRLSVEALIRIENDSEVYAYSPEAAEEKVRVLTELVASFEHHTGGPGSLLDLGCNRGFLMEAARRRGWEPTGVEISMEAANRARADYGLRVVPTIESLVASDSFDLVVAWHVLEHTREPVVFLRQVGARLRAGGFLALQVPSFGRLQEYRDRGQTTGLLCAVHNFYFTRDSLSAVLELGDFSVADLVEDQTCLTAMCRLPADRQRALGRELAVEQPSSRASLAQPGRGGSPGKRMGTRSIGCGRRERNRYWWHRLTRLLGITPAELRLRLRVAKAASMIRRSHLFNANFYLERNPDVAAVGIDPVRHYLLWGASEGRDPHPEFDTSFYLETYPDVASAGVNPLVHYLMHGAAEGRKTRGPRNASLYDAGDGLPRPRDGVVAGEEPMGEALPVGESEGMALCGDDRENRLVLGNRFISGRGFEIGAGASPSRYQGVEEIIITDKRTREEVAELFKTSIGYDVVSMEEALALCRRRGPADFVVAHHVLEHTANPIQTVIDWLSLLRHRGRFFISIPSDKNPCEKDRIPTPLEHILDDYVFQRSGDDYESKGHILSFISQWTVLSPDNFWYTNNGVTAFAETSLREMRRDGHDLHWHTYRLEVAKQVVEAACYFAGKRVEWLACEEAAGAIYLIGEKRRLRDPAPEAMPRFMAGHRDRLKRAMDVLDRPPA